MGFRKTDGGDSSNVEVFSNAELLSNVLHTGIKIIFVPIPSAKVESRQ